MADNLHLFNEGKNPHYDATSAEDAALIEMALNESKTEFKIVEHNDYDKKEKTLRFFVAPEAFDEKMNEKLKSVKEKIAKNEKNYKVQFDMDTEKHAGPFKPKQG